MSNPISSITPDQLHDESQTLNITEQPKLISRRGFLQLSAGAAGMSLLSACNVPLIEEPQQAEEGIELENIDDAMTLIEKYVPTEDYFETIAPLVVENLDAAYVDTRPVSIQEERLIAINYPQLGEFGEINLRIKKGTGFGAHSLSTSTDGDFLATFSKAAPDLEIILEHHFNWGELTDIEKKVLTVHELTHVMQLTIGKFCAFKLGQKSLKLEENDIKVVAPAAAMIYGRLFKIYQDRGRIESVPYIVSNLAFFKSGVPKESLANPVESIVKNGPFMDFFGEYLNENTTPEDLINTPGYEKFKDKIGNPLGL